MAPYYLQNKVPALPSGIQGHLGIRPAFSNLAPPHPPTAPCPSFRRPLCLCTQLPRFQHLWDRCGGDWHGFEHSTHTVGELEFIGLGLFRENEPTSGGQSQQTQGQLEEAK